MPLTKAELKRYLHGGDDHYLWEEVEQELHRLVDHGLVRHEDGYYFLADQTDDFVAVRHQSRELANVLLESSRPWLRLIAAFPGVESIAVCNNLAFLNATTNSDIDVFIITKPGQLWQTRFFLAAVMHLLGKRPTPETNYGKFCLSFLISSDALSLSHVLHDDDPYFEYWFASLLPVYDPEGMLPRFMEANRMHWSHIGVHPPFAAKQIDQNRSVTSRVLSLISRPFHRLLEKQTREWQEKRFPEAIRRKLSQAQTDVVVSDTMLKFHTLDRRTHYRDLWRQRMEELGIMNL